MLYNSLWTSLTCLFAYALERDINYAVTRNNPHLYEAGQQKLYFSFKIFWKWVALSLFHGAITFTGCTFGFRGIIDSSGKNEDLWFASTIAFSCIIHLVTVKLAIELNFLNWIAMVAGIFSVVFYWLVAFILNTSFVSQMVQPEIEFVYWRILSNFKAWMVIIFLPLIALLPDITIKYFFKLYKQDKSDEVTAMHFNRDKKIKNSNTMIRESQNENINEEEGKPNTAKPKSNYNTMAQKKKGRTSRSEDE